VKRDVETRTERPAWIAGIWRWAERDPAAALVRATIRFGIWGAVCTGILGLLMGLSTTAVSTVETLPWISETAALAYVLGELRPVPAAIILGTVLVDAALLGYFAYLIRRQLTCYRQSEARLRKQLAEITLLQEAISAVHDLRSEDALQRVVEIVTHVLGFQRAVLYLSDQVQEMFPRVYHSCRSTSRDVALEPIEIDDGLLNALLRLRTPVVIDGVRGLVGVTGGDAVQIAVPLNSDRGALGVLVADSHDRQSSSQADKEVLARLAKSAVVAIENASLHRGIQRMANRDGLTNLYNYRYFQKGLREVLAAAGTNWPVSLLMIEIDKFKRYNDTYGHRQGDKALCSFARALEACTEPWNGLVARYGGDEFVVILARAGQEEAAEVAHTVHEQVYQQTLGALAEHGLPPVTMSIGVATYPKDALNAEDLIEAADRAMYMVKYKGGNRVHVYSESATALS
jgi:diguanylate cyclase (GGDEF)-like protein